MEYRTDVVPDESFIQAVSYALRKGTWNVLREPKIFLGYLMDHADDCSELRVMSTQCDQALLEPFVRVADEQSSLETAVETTVLRLTTDRMIGDTPARLVAAGIACGICRYLGISYETGVKRQKGSGRQKAQGKAASARDSGAGGRKHVSATDRIGMLASPMVGQAMDLSESPDVVFASGALGKGAVIMPKSGEVYSPCSGIVGETPTAGNFINLVSNDGAEVYMHIGVDTFELGSAPFTMHVSPGDRVRAGDLLITADLGAIRAAGKSTATMVIVINTEDFESIVVTRIGSVRVGEPLIRYAGDDEETHAPSGSEPRPKAPMPSGSQPRPKMKAAQNHAPAPQPRQNEVQSGRKTIVDGQGMQQVQNFLIRYGFLMVILVVLAYLLIGAVLGNVLGSCAR